jgi:hypothetical protein
LADYCALYAGGEAFDKRKMKLVPQNVDEQNDIYQHRLNQVHYRNYAGPIIDYFASHLFAAPFEVRAKGEDDEPTEPDEFYGEFREDCDGIDTDFCDFLRARFVEALQVGVGYWLVEFPDDGADEPLDRAEFQHRKLGDGYLRAVCAEDVLDWECDEIGQLDWVIVHKKEKRRDDPRVSRNLITETWWLYDRETVETFQVTYEPSKPPRDEDIIKSLGRRPHRCNVVPLIALRIDPEGLWVMNRIASTQLEHMRIANANAWSIRRTCFAMPVVKVEDGQNPPKFGVGRYMMIGVNESFEWAAPPSVPYEAMRNEVASLKDEIFRICHQMALGVDNNAAAIGRSGESKMADAHSTEVVLKAYGALVLKAAEETYEVLSDARGDTDVTWSIEGFQRFNLADALVLVESVNAAATIDIPSETFQKEIKTKVALGLLHDVAQDVKDTIREEIAEGITDQMAMKAEGDQAKLDADKLAAQPPPMPGLENGKTLALAANKAVTAKGSADKDEKVRN